MSYSSICEGCEKSGFSWSGYWSHLQQSKNPRCAAVLRKLNQSMGFESDSDLDSEQLGAIDDANDADDTAQAVPFVGDAFGNAEDYLREDLEHDYPADNGEATGAGVELEIDEEEAAAAAAAELEIGWEPRREGAHAISGVEGDAGLREPMSVASRPASPAETQDNAEGEDYTSQARRVAEERLECDPFIVRYTSCYPLSRCGAIKETRPTSDQQYASKINNSTNPWAPFASEIDWKVARWAKLRGAGSTAFSDLLAINGVCDALGLSFKNTDELNKIIDNELPRRPAFKRHEVVVADQAFELYARDIVECLKALWGDLEFSPYLIIEPERHYADEDHTIKIYHDMQTGKWWWATQKEVEKTTGKKGITIVPIIISSDKTQLTTFRNKTAYPVYLTIGNIPKHIRRKPSRQGQVLLAYLPTSKLDHIKNKSARRRTLANLFHVCMRFILRPLEKLGLTGIPLTSGDGAVRDCHPILAAYVGDYPEQVLVTCTKTGECPTGTAGRDELGDPNCICAPRDLDAILDALDTIDQGATVFTQACKDAGIKPIQQPFWKNLPFVNIFCSITPDILHQLYQGMVKHLIGWIRKACGDAEIDARCRRLPPNHHIHLFMKGISHLSRVTGTEHDQICRFLLGIIIDICLPHGYSNQRLLRAVRGLLDFVYLARYPVHTAETLDQLEEALQTFNEDRKIFIDLGIRLDFNFPKAHFTGHYRALMERYGTCDNFNTEYTERLHIDLAKDAYRSTNMKDEYPQMTAWLDRRERMVHHDKFLQCYHASASTVDETSITLIPPRIPPLIYPRSIKMAVRASAYGVSLTDVQTLYGALQFKAALSRFVIHLQHPQLPRRQVELRASEFHIPFQKLSVFHRIKYVSQDPFSINPLVNIVVDSIHSEPARQDKHGKFIPGRFDTAVINYKNGGRTGVKGYCIGRIRCVFMLPASAIRAWFPDRSPPEHLAYVEWFTPFASLQPGRNHGLYKISRHLIQGNQQASVIPINLIRQSVHLIPGFGPIAPSSWKSSSVLDLAPYFYVNRFSDRFPYSTLL